MNRVSIRTKLWASVVSAALATCCIAVAALWFSYQHIYEERVAKLQSIVEMGHAMAARYEALAVKGVISHDEAQARFKDSLTAIRYSGDGYLFAYTYDQVGFSHINPKFVGRSNSDLKDSDGIPIIPALVKIVKERNEGTYSYSWPLHPDDANTAIKLAYVKGFDPWNIFIGTGVFIDDIRADFMSMVGKIAMIMLALVLPAIALIAWTGSSISRRIRGVASKMQALADGDLDIRLPEARSGDEIGQMARTVEIFRNGMAENSGFWPSRRRSRRARSKSESGTCENWPTISRARSDRSSVRSPLRPRNWNDRPTRSLRTPIDRRTSSPK